MKGIDISSNNGPIDFKRVKAGGVEIVYIKATEGTNYINSLLAIQYQGAKSAGLKIGFYHFMSHENATIQANFFLKAIKDFKADCKYVIDIEQDKRAIWSTSDASRATREFANFLISQGKEPCIYTGDYFYRDNLSDTVKDLPLWVANYGTNILAKNYVGLQYTEAGRLEGVNGNVDLDNFSIGILLKPVIKVEEVKKVKHLVVIGNSVDKRAGEYLADYFQCPIIDGSLPFDYTTVDNVWCVGGQPSLPFTCHANKIIAGSTRYDTCQKVLDFIKSKPV